MDMKKLELTEDERVWILATTKGTLYHIKDKKQRQFFNNLIKKLESE